MPTFYMRTQRLCTRRNADSQKIYDWMTVNGWDFIPDVTAADVVILCTCAATEVSEGQTVYNLKDILARKSDAARLIVTGCLPKINPERLSELGNFEIVNPTSLEDFDMLLGARVSIREIPEDGAIIVPDFVAEAESPIAKLKRLAQEFKFDFGFIRSRVKRFGKRFSKEPALEPPFDIRIAKGCLGNCTYCGIKFAIGRLQSRPPDEIVEQFREGLRKGYKRLRLVGSDTGCYGLDIGLTAPDLLRQILATEGDYRVEILDFNPQWLIRFYDALVEILAANSGKVTEIMIPIESGSNRILRLMKRPYDIDTVKAKIQDFKKRFPDIRIITHIIVGFPGETEAEFKESMSLASEIGFSDGWVFPYCDRPNTEAGKMDNKIPKRVIVRRSAELASILCA
jgi:MiaB/RimO family radical SAM methylthiotransferase